MIQQGQVFKLDGLPARVIGFEASGKIAAEDYRDQLPRNRPVEHLPQRLGRFEAVPSGTVDRLAQTCSGGSTTRRTSPKPAVAFPSSQRSFAPLR